MSTQRTLIFGRMPLKSTPETHLPAGPWCFAGQEDFFPNWQNTSFPPEPLWETEHMKCAAEEAKTLAANTLELLPACVFQLSKSAALYERFSSVPPPAHIPTALPAPYWEMLFGPWSIVAAQTLLDRWLRIQAIVRLWGDEPLCVPLLPTESTFLFATEESFIHHGALGLEFNHWIFSRLLEAAWPQQWEKILLPAVHLTYTASDVTGKTKRTIFQSALSRLIRALPFSRIHGASLMQALHLSCHLGNTAHDASRPLNRYSTSQCGRELNFPCPTLPLMLAMLPVSLRTVKHPHALRHSTRPKLKVVHLKAYDDIAYRQQIALWRGKGHRLLVVQDAGHEGQAAVSCGASFIAYSQHAYATWGWQQHSDYEGNFLRLPNFKLTALQTMRHNAGKYMLFASKGMPLLSCQMDSLPTPLQWPEYRHLKEVFFQKLPRPILEQCLYFPHTSRSGFLEDAPWLLPRFPQIHLCTRQLHHYLPECRLAVLDHYGTAMAMAMTANIPLIAYWNKDAWPLSPEANAAVKILKEAEIWFSNPEDAALKSIEIWDAPHEWWQSPAIQDARHHWIAHFAYTEPANPLIFWRDALNKL